MAPRSSVRYQLRAGSQLLRYLPIFAGAVLATVFVLSILRDGIAIAEAAWVAGDELLGLFGGFGVVVVPLLFVVTAVLRRGVARPLTHVHVAQGTLVLGRAGAHDLDLPLENIRSGYTERLADGRMRHSLELGGGMSEGDRVVLEVSAQQSEALAELIPKHAPRFDFESSSWLLGAALSLASLVLGSVIAARVLEDLAAVAVRLPKGAIAESPGDGLVLGITLAAVGVVRALLSIATHSPDVVVGHDGVRVEGFIRRRFVDYRDIASVTRTRAATFLRLRNRRLIWLCGPLSRSAQVDALAARIEQGVAQASRRDELALPSSLQVCRQRFRVALEGTGYRDRALAPEALRSELERPGAPSVQRVAAALMLLESGETPERIRAAAAGLAEDDVRAALERVAEGEADLATLEELLQHRQRA